MFVRKYSIYKNSPLFLDKKDVRFNNETLFYVQNLTLKLDSVVIWHRSIILGI